MKKQVIFISSNGPTDWSDFAGYNSADFIISEPGNDLNRIREEILQNNTDILLIDADTLKSDFISNICAVSQEQKKLPIFLLSEQKSSQKLLGKDYCSTAGFIEKPLNFTILPIILQSKIYELALSEALKNSEATTKALLEVDSDLAMVTNLAGEIIYVNQSMSQFLQRPIHNLINRKCSDILDEQLYAQRFSYIRKSFESGETVKFIDNYQAHVYENRIYPIKDRSGKPIRVALYSRDITQNQLDHAKLTQLMKAVETIQLGVSILDMEMKVIYCNRAEASMHGYEVKELLGKPVSIFRPQDYPQESLDEIMQRYQGIGREIINLKKSGERFPVRIISDMVLDESGKPFALVSTCEDISQQKLLESQLLRSQRLAGVGNLSAGIAHEIRNPLGNISSAAQLCRKNNLLDKNVDMFLEIIQRNCEYANKVISDLVEFAHPREIEKKADSLNNILERAVQAKISRFHTESKQLIVCKAKELPLLELDSRWLQTSFENIIDNSADALAEDGWLKVTTEINDKKISICFEDNGYGISPTNLEKIFDPFFTTKNESVGLGLSSLNYVLTGHRAELKIESEQNIGTKIKIFFSQCNDRWW